MLKHANLATTTITGNINASVLTIPIASAALFPAMAAGDQFYGALINSSNAVEFVQVSGISGLNVTIASGGRGAGGTAALSWVTGDRFELHIIDQSLLILQQECLKGTAAAGTDTYTSTLVPTPQGYISGLIYAVIFANTNTSPTPNWNANSLGAKTIVLDAAAVLLAGQLPKCALLQYDGTNMVLLNPNSNAASAIVYFSTGDMKPTYKITADSSWVMLNDGTIGDATSGSSTRANADTSALFTLLYNNTVDANTPILTSTGIGTTRAAQGSAATAFAAHCRLTLPPSLGRTFGCAGAGAGLTSRALGATVGVETYALSTAELAAHSHTITDPGHAHAGVPNLLGASNILTAGNDYGQSSQSTSVAATGITGTNSNGSGTAHQNMQPTLFANWMIKL